MFVDLLEELDQFMNNKYPTNKAELEISFVSIPFSFSSIFRKWWNMMHEEMKIRMKMHKCEQTQKNILHTQAIQLIQSNGFMFYTANSVFVWGNYLSFAFRKNKYSQYNI